MRYDMKNMQSMMPEELKKIIMDQQEIIHKSNTDFLAATEPSKEEVAVSPECDHTEYELQIEELEEAYHNSEARRLQLIREKDEIIQEQEKKIIALDAVVVQLEKQLQAIADLLQ